MLGFSSNVSTFEICWFQSLLWLWVSKLYKIKLVYGYGYPMKETRAETLQKDHAKADIWAF